MRELGQRIMMSAHHGWTRLAHYPWLFRFVKLNLGYWAIVITYDLVAACVPALWLINWSAAWRIWALLILILVVNRALALQGRDDQDDEN